MCPLSKKQGGAWGVSVVAMMLVLLMGANAEAQDWQPVYDGVDFVEDFNGIHAVRIDMDLVGVSIIPHVMDSSYKGKGASPMGWAKEKGYQIAINANFYDMSNTTPLSVAVSEGDAWHKGNDGKYAQMGFTKDGRIKWESMASTEGIQPWMYNVVTGIGELVVDGIPKDEKYNKKGCDYLGHCYQSRARTAFGVSEDRKYIYLVVSKGEYANGATISGFAKQVQALGAYYAINLDGGPSSGLYIESHNKMYGAQSGRKVALDMGFKVLPKPDYVCKVADVDDPGAIIQDMSASHLGLAAAESVLQHELTQGCGDDPNHKMFCPNCGMLRKDAAVWVARAMGLEMVTPAAPSFEDVSAELVGSEAFGYIEALAEKGILTKGEPFRPNAVLTKAEAAVMLAGSFVADIHAYKDPLLSTFSDVPREHLGFPYIEAAVRNCIIVDDGSHQYGPDNAMNRVEFASMLARAANYIPRDNCSFTPQCTNNGSAECSENTVVSCRANELIYTDCNDDELCIEGECHKDIPCDSTYQAVCDGMISKSCVLGKVAFENCTQACENGQCVECLSTDMPKCDESGESYCSDGKIQTNACKAGEKCGSNGVCLEESGCTNDDYKCVGNYLYVCNQADWSLFLSCQEQGLICSSGACVLPCEPGKAECMGNGIRRCGADYRWENPEPCGDKKVCSEGVCVDEIIPDEPSVPSNPVEPTEPDEDEPAAPRSSSGSDSSCSIGSGQSHGVFALIALLLGGLWGLRRRSCHE